MWRQRVRILETALEFCLPWVPESSTELGWIQPPEYTWDHLGMVNLNDNHFSVWIGSHSNPNHFHFTISSKVDHSCSGTELQDHPLNSYFGNGHVFCSIWALVKMVFTMALLSRIETKMLYHITVLGMEETQRAWLPERPEQAFVQYINSQSRLIMICYSKGCMHCFSNQCVCSVTQSCLTLCDPLDYSLPGSSVHGIFPGKNTGVGCISYSRGSSWPRDETCISCVFCIGRGILYHCSTWEALINQYLIHVGLFRWLGGKESACQCRKCWRRGSYPWVGKIPGGGNGNPLQYFCLDRSWQGSNPMDKGAWWATVHGITKSQTRLSNWTRTCALYI